LHPIKLLVVDDDTTVLAMATRVFGAKGIEVETSTDPIGTAARVESGNSPWDAVLLDLTMPGLNGLELLDKFKQAGSPSAIIVLSGDGTADSAAACMRNGAFDYLTKPCETSRMLEVVEAAARYSQMRRAAHTTTTGADDVADSLLVGVSSAMRTLRGTIQRVAKQNASILIQGESGCGKELVARMVHDVSPRSEATFVALNCGAIPEGLIDSELFGHHKGAFTGATTDRHGVFVEAHGGTLFLDEIGDMPMAVQARLLRVLQTGEVRTVGGTGTREVDVRVLAATHVDLAEAVANGTFRQDLYYRLNVVVLSIPPLRDRIEDLPVLVASLLHKHAGDDHPSLEPSALETMMRYAWPGNVRELENALQHALALRIGDDDIGLEHLPEHVRLRAKGSRPIPMPGEAAEGSGELSLADAKKKVTTEFERSYLVRVMTETNGSVNRAARLAGMDRTNFRRLLQRHNIDPDSFR
jgi:DNA-binding NtrC family response regulator